MLNLYDILLKEEKKLLKENLGREMQKARKELRAAGYSDEDAKKKVEAWEAKPCFRKSKGKYLQGYARLFLNNEIMDGEYIDNKTKMVERIIDLINRKYSEEFNRNLESVSDGHKWNVDELIKRFSEEVKQELEDAVENGQNKGVTENSEYEFVRIPNFKDANEYSSYTSWCVTHAASNYNSYTNYGKGIFIFCLKHGFEDVPKERTEGNPMDEYGTSMIAISVDEDGDLHTCTCRWNHDCGAGDQMMTREEVEEFFHVNFAETFYPRTEEEMYDNEDDEIDEDTAMDMIADDAFYFGNEFSLRQSVDDVIMNGELKPETEAVYGLYYEDTNLSDFEYYKTDGHEVSGNYAILKGRSSNTYDLYVYNNDGGETLKNIYAWEDIDDYLVGSYLKGNKYLLFSVNLDDGEIWDGTDRFGRSVEVEEGIRFERLENMSDEYSSYVDRCVFYLLQDSDGAITIVDVEAGRIVCMKEHLKLPEGLEEISELMPYYDEEEGEAYFLTEDGHKIDVYSGSIETMKRNNFEVHLLKRLGNFNIYFFKDRRNYQYDSEIRVDIWFNDHWVFETMGIEVPLKGWQNKIEPMFSHFVCYTKSPKGYYSDASKYIIDLNTCKQVLPEIKTCAFTNVSKWGYAKTVKTPYEYYIFNDECKLLFPKIIQFNDLKIASYSCVIFEGKPNLAYMMSWKKAIVDDTVADAPFIINKDRPFDVSKQRLRAVDNYNKIIGVDENGYQISYTVGENEVKELQTEQYRHEFKKMLDKLKKR